MVRECISKWRREQRALSLCEQEDGRADAVRGSSVSAGNGHKDHSQPERVEKNTFTMCLGWRIKHHSRLCLTRVELNMCLPPRFPSVTGVRHSTTV